VCGERENALPLDPLYTPYPVGGAMVEMIPNQYPIKPTTSNQQQPIKPCNDYNVSSTRSNQMILI